MMILSDPYFLIASGVFIASVFFLIWLLRQWKQHPESESAAAPQELMTPALPEQETFSPVPLPTPEFQASAPSAIPPGPAAAVPAAASSLNEEMIMKLMDTRFQALTQRFDSLEKVFDQLTKKMANGSSVASPQAAVPVEDMKKTMEELKFLLQGLRDGGDDVLSSLNSKMDVIQKVIVNLVSDFDAEKK